MRSHALKPCALCTGDLVKVFVRNEIENRGKWLFPRQIISLDTKYGMLTVPGLAGKTVTATIEEVQAVFPVSYITQAVLSDIDELDERLDDEFAANISDTQLHPDTD